MDTNKARYITTTLPYVNADPHIGFGYEIVGADALARLWRLMGCDVFFTTGSDEHGQKVETAAKKEGTPTQEYVDLYTSKVESLKEDLNLRTDNFIRTTDPAHKEAAQELWKRCLEKGDIYKKKYKGLYCVADELFVRESDLVDGRCPNHPTLELQEVEEENYFFKFSNYEKELISYLENEESISPEWRRQEAIRFVKNGLEDFSISREKEKMGWGVAVPGDDTQVMYVWFDALTNYISTLGWPEDKEGKFKKFWEEGETLQFAGKDQVRFQSLMWQAMLLSADIKTTDKVFYHGFVTSGGQKMSKSIGNVISPRELVERYGTDATRYLLLRHVHPFEDTDVTWERLDEWYEAGLVNGLGNLVARIMKLAETHLSEPIDAPQVDVASEVARIKKEKNIDEFRFDQTLDQIFISGIDALDQKITETEPFKVIKTDEEKGKELIQELTLELYKSVSLLLPFMPETVEVIQKTILENKKPENLFPRLS